MKGLVAALTVALGLAVLAAPQKVERKAVFCGGSGDRELSKCCALSGKENPKLLLFCTANGDAAWSVEGAAKQGAKFTTNAEVVKLFEPEMTTAELRAKILGADVVFFYGGATEKIAERLSFWHLDDALRLAYARGTVLAGYSAGAIILSHAGLTDFPNDRYDLITGLGVVDCYFCPHYEGGRWKEFDARLDEETDESLPREAWALERGMAVVFRDGRPEVVSNNPKGHVYRFTRNQGVWTKREVPAPRKMSGTWVSLGTSITWYNDNLKGMAGRGLTRGYQDRVRDVLAFDGFLNLGCNGGTIGIQLGSVKAGDYYTIEHGINDWGHSVPVGTIDDYRAPSATNRTFCATYRRLIDKIRSLNPQAKIILCTPRKGCGFRGYLPSRCDEPKNGIYLREYADAVRAIAAEEGFPLVDFYATCGEQDELASLSIDVALHPNDAGFERMAEELLKAFATVE